MTPHCFKSHLGTLHWYYRASKSKSFRLCSKWIRCQIAETSMMQHTRMTRLIQMCVLSPGSLSILWKRQLSPTWARRWSSIWQFTVPLRVPTRSSPPSEPSSSPLEASMQHRSSTTGCLTQSSRLSVFCSVDPSGNWFSHDHGHGFNHAKAVFYIL